MRKNNLKLGDFFKFIKAQRVNITECFPECFMQLVEFANGEAWGHVIEAKSLEEAEAAPVSDDFFSEYFNEYYCRENVAKVSVEPYVDHLYTGKTDSIPVSLVNYYIDSIEVGHEYEKHGRSKELRVFLQINVTRPKED